MRVRVGQVQTHHQLLDLLLLRAAVVVEVVMELPTDSGVVAVVELACWAKAQVVVAVPQFHPLRQD
jgi:hypothetical protein